MDRNDPTLQVSAKNRSGRRFARDAVSHPEFDRRDPMRGYPIGPYRVVTELGRGGQGKVYLADDPRLRRKVALKVLTSLGNVSEQVLARFQREAEVASRLDHPGICAVYDTGVERGVPYIAMRYVPGDTLSQKLRLWSTGRDGSVSDFEIQTDADAKASAGSRSSQTSGRSAQESREQLRIAVEIVRKACMAVHAAHEAGVVHRDLKPGNIMVTPEGDAVVLDFGLAREMDSELPSLTQTGEFFGTPNYMSPEQVSGGSTDVSADVWALGVILYEALTLHRPFEAPTRQAMYRGILSRTQVDPRTYNPAISADLKVVIDKALEKERGRRYATAKDFADDLARVLEDRPVMARPVSLAGRVMRWARREPAKAILAGAVTVAVLTAAGLGGYLSARMTDFDRAETRLRVDEREDALERGFLDLGEGSARRALHAFRHALRIDPASFEAHAGCALALTRLKLRDQALEFVESATTLTPSERARLKAEVLCGLGQHDEEKRVLATIEKPVDGPLALFMKGTRAMRRGHGGDHEAFETAFNAFNRAILTSPRARALLHFQRAHAARHMGNRQAVEESVEALKALWPDCGRAWFWVGFSLRKFDPDESAIAYAKAIELDPGLLIARNNLGEVLISLGRHDDAEPVLESALDVALEEDDRTTIARVHLNRARIADARGLPDVEVAELRRATEVAPTLVAGWTRLAKVLLARGDHVAGIAAFERAVRARPSDGDVRASYAVALRKLKRYDEALQTLEEAVAVDPKSERAWLNLGVSRRRARDAAGARKAYERALAIRPGYAQALNNLGNLEVDARDPKAARARYEDAIRSDPGLMRARINLAKLHARAKRLDDAIDVLSAAVKHAPTHGEAHETLLKLLHRDGRTEEIVAEAQRWAVAHPEGLDAWADYTRLLLRLNGRDDLSDPHATVAAARKTLELSGPDSLPHILDLARALSDLGFLVEAEAWMEKAVTIAKKSGDPDDRSAVRRTMRQMARE